MPWTPEAKIESLLRLPWTITSEPSDAGEFILRVTELPGMIVIGTPEELETEFWAALRASLACAVEFDEITLPKGRSLPWETKPVNKGLPHRAFFRGTWNAVMTSETAASSDAIAAMPS